MDKAGYNARTKLEDSDDDFDEFYDRTNRKPVVTKTQEKSE